MLLRDRVFNAADWLFWKLFSRSFRVVVIDPEGKLTITAARSARKRIAEMERWLEGREKEDQWTCR